MAADVQGFHILSDVKHWQPHRKCRPVVDAGRWEVVKQCRWALLKPQQGFETNTFFDASNEMTCFWRGQFLGRATHSGLQ